MVQPVSETCAQCRSPIKGTAVLMDASRKYGITRYQDNQSCSVKGVLRGLHFQKQFPQGKLVRVVKGSVYDVAVDLRNDSETYGKWFGVGLLQKTKSSFTSRKVLPMIF